MATTPNYGFIMPDPTDFVTNLPADFEIFGDEVDSRIKALNPETTAGDISYRGATANAKVRLPIGTAGQVLRVNSGATAPEWFTPAGSSKSFTLLNSGNTTVGTGSSVTYSGISNIDDLLILIAGVSSGSNSSNLLLRFNSDSGSNYEQFGAYQFTGATYNANNADIYTQQNANSITLAIMSNNANSSMSGSVRLSGCNSTNSKVYQAMCGASPFGGNGQQTNWVGGVYRGTSAITSITLVSTLGNFDTGDVRIYGAA